MPVLVDFKDNTDDLFAHAVERSKEEGLISNGDLVIITAGVPISISERPTFSKSTWWGCAGLRHRYQQALPGRHLVRSAK